MKKGWKLFWRIVLSAIFATLMSSLAYSFGVFESIRVGSYDPLILFAFLGTVIITCLGFIRMDTNADITPMRYLLPFFGSVGFSFYASIQEATTTNSAVIMIKTLVVSVVYSVIGVIIGMVVGGVIMYSMNGLEQIYTQNKSEKQPTGG